MILLVRNGMHAEIVIDASHPIGKDRPGRHVADVILESAVTHDHGLRGLRSPPSMPPDKVLAYRNWLGLMKGDLVERFEKGGKTVERKLNPDRTYTAPDGSALTLHGRSL
ncbi:MAG: hypothetical protein ACMVO3_07000 [Thalassobaculum sp.]